MANADDLKRLIVALSAAYRAEFDKATVATWARAVRDVPGDLLDEASDAWIRTSPHMPRPAEILQTVKSIAHRRELAQKALPPPRDPEKQREINRQGMALVRSQLRQGKLRIGTHIDDVIDKEEASE